MLKLKESSLEWARKHINKYGDTYIFPIPFEFEAINEYWDEVKAYLLNLDVFNNGLREYRTAISPKSKLGFRISTQLDPLDSIIYSAIVYEIWEEIENSRMPSWMGIVFSFRLGPKKDGTLFDPNYNWGTFNIKAREIVESEEYSYVVVTDISDFFPSIYRHNIETYLRECLKDSGKTAHGETLINVIKAMHANQTHKGLPIGPQFSRPIAELVLNQIDDILLENGIKYIRCVDDYRIFCNNESEAYQNLAFLAQKFYDLLNLKLNESKTKILTIERFAQDYLKVYKEVEKNKILEEFYELCDQLGISTSEYDEIVDLEELEQEDREKLEELNIIELLNEELSKENIDMGFIKFLIGNLARFNNTEVADYILKEENMKNTFTILKSIINYLERVRSFDESHRHKIGKKVLKLIENNFMSKLDFNRSWLLNLFTKDEEWNNQHAFIDLINKYTDNLTKRELLLALGRSKNIKYFRENKMLNLSTVDPWVRRAFLGAISCLPKDERMPWYKARNLKNRDFLDTIVEKWAQKNHF